MPTTLHRSHANQPYICLAMIAMMTVGCQRDDHSANNVANAKHVRLVGAVNSQGQAAFALELDRARLIPLSSADQVVDTIDQLPALGVTLDSIASEDADGRGFEIRTRELIDDAVSASRNVVGRSAQALSALDFVRDRFAAPRDFAKSLITRTIPIFDRSQLTSGLGHLSHTIALDSVVKSSRAAWSRLLAKSGVLPDPALEFAIPEPATFGTSAIRGGRGVLISGGTPVALATLAALTVAVLPRAKKGATSRADDGAGAEPRR